jgi:dihydropteroate synthase
MARRMGARLFRVHEALPHAEALRITESLLES